MNRTTPVPKREITARDIQWYTTMAILRNRLGTSLGMQYDGARDIYKALGYKKDLSFSDYLNSYLRQDIAKAVIDRPVKATWQGQLELVENQESDHTEFEQAWLDLNKQFSLRSLFSRVDRLTCLGKFGILMLGLDDVSTSEGFKLPVNKRSPRKLRYIRPFGEGSVKVEKLEERTNNERYGLPLIYSVQSLDVSTGKTQTLQLHHTRVIHITDGNLESEVYGIPVLEAVYNRLMDLDKIVGGAAEMFWRGGRGGFQGVLDKDFGITETEKQGIIDQIDDYENDIRRILLTEGYELKALEQQIADPKNSFDVELACISAVTGIPKRILSGTERGELASSQDSWEWKTYVQARREDHVEPHIIRPFVTRLQEYRILPMVDDYTVDWLDLFSVSEKERVDIGKARASAIREYTTNPSAFTLMPPDAFFELCLGLSTQQIELVHAIIASGISEEQKDLAEDLKELQVEPQPEGGVSPQETASPAEEESDTE